MTICTTAFVIEAGEGPDPTFEMIGAWVAEYIHNNSVDCQLGILGSYAGNMHFPFPNPSIQAHALGNGASKRILL